MDIQSSTFNELFVLYPVIIQGWITPVKPDGVAHGGIPQALYDDQTQGLECLADPWTELQLLSWTMAADDRVDLYVNDDPNPVTGKTVAPGEEQLRVRLYLAHGRLNQGVNRLHYKVTRVGGNVESSRDLLVLYHLRLPESLELVIPPDVLRDGVGPERAAQGVTLGFNYSNRRKYDVIACMIGDTTVRFDVPDAPAAINQTLFTDTFKRAGDNPSAVLEFRVFDQLGNVVKSGEKRLDIHLGRVTLLAPTVRGMNGNQFSPTTPEVRVLVPQGSLLRDDTLRVKWTGATAVAAGSYTSPPRLVSAGLEIAVPRSVLAYSLGQQVTVTYFIERDGNTTESPPLLLNILPLPATALIAPKIVEADANNFVDVLALGTKNATIHTLLHTLIEAGQQCWLRLEGKKADGSAHDLTLWNGLPAQVNSTWINQGFWPATLANSYLKQLGHGTTLTIKYKVALDKSNIEADAVVFPDRTYTVKAVVALTIDDSQMLLHAVKLLQNYGWGSKEVPGNVDTRQATGGTPPYIYQSDNPAVASVTLDGKVAGLRNGATTIRVSDQSGSTVSFAVDVRNVFQVIRGSATYSGDPQGDLDAQRWVYSQGGIRLPDNSYLEPLSANFTNVYGDVFEGTPVDRPRGKCCVESAVPPRAYYGNWMAMHSDGTFWFSSGSQPQLARAIAFVPT
ncbi:Ig-like domain-containing protein [Pseudomonas neuropathica]|uniref:Ig-like domain-containing protein n=1 Tax=Pseudomonas neuropathica TaxID=2730425 RepID=UPI003EBB8948